MFVSLVTGGHFAFDPAALAGRQTADSLAASHSISSSTSSRGLSSHTHTNAQSIVVTHTHTFEASETSVGECQNRSARRFGVASGLTMVYTLNGSRHPYTESYNKLLLSSLPIITFITHSLSSPSAPFFPSRTTYTH